MDIHKPQPWRGWSELLKEIGTIVLGVSIAIGFEQAVEWRHWRHKLADADAAVRFELHDDDMPQAYARIVVRGCLDKRLDALTAALATNQSRETFARLARDYLPPLRTWDMNARHVMASSDVLARLTAEDALHRSQAYNVMPALGETNTQEGQHTTDLGALDPKPGVLTTAERDRAVLAVRRLRFDNRQMFALSVTLLRASEDLAVTLTETDRARVISELRPRWGDCLVDPQTNLRSLKSQAPVS